MQKIQPIKSKSVFFNSKQSLGIYDRKNSFLAPAAQQGAPKQQLAAPKQPLVAPKNQLKEVLINNQPLKLQNNGPSESIIIFKELTLVLFLTHVWTENIKTYFLKLKENCDLYFFDIVILVCNEKGSSADLVVQIKKSLDMSIMIFQPTLKEIRSMYAEESFSKKGLWACNHWLLMWLWKYYAKDLGYKKVWSFEYDIRFNGSLEPIFSIDCSYDYVYAKAMVSRKGQSLSFWGPIATNWSPNWTSLKQFFRVSDVFLNYLHEQFLLGNNGQDEMTLASHAQEPFNYKLGIFKSIGCAQYLCDTWSPSPNLKTANEWSFYEKLVRPKLKLFHPIKN